MILQKLGFLQQLMLTHNISMDQLPSIISAIVDPNPPLEHQNSSDTVRRVLMQLLNDPQYYKINGEFLTVLDTKANLKLETEYFRKKLPQKHFFCLEFPHLHREVFDESYLKTAIVYVPDDMIAAEKESDSWDRCLIIVSPFYSTESDLITGAFNIHYLRIPKISNLERNWLDSPNNAANAVTLHFTIKVLKILLYILSDGNPDLRHMKPVSLKTKKPKKRKRIILAEEIFPVTLVGFNFCKDPWYTKAEWNYLKWQPYGSRADPKYKLIHIFAKRRKPLMKGDK